MSLLDKSLKKTSKGDRAATLKTAANMVETQRFGVDIPVDLHRKFKAKCTMRGETMRDVVLDAIKDYVEEK